MPHELGIIGAGNMAEAILRGVIDGAFLAPEEILVAEPRDDRRRQLGDELGIACTADNAEAVRAPRVVLAVKPQKLAEALAGLAGVVDPDTLVVSIAAGITTRWLDETLGRRGRVVRVMPNTPMLVGAGMSAICAGPRATDADLDPEFATKFLNFVISEVIRHHEQIRDGAA